MSIQGALSGATNQIIGASIAAAKKKEKETKKVQDGAPSNATPQKSDAEILASMGINVDPSRINTTEPVSRRYSNPNVDETRRKLVMQEVALAQESRKLSKEQSKLYMQKLRSRRKRGA